MHLMSPKPPKIQYKQFIKLHFKIIIKWYPCIILMNIQGFEKSCLSSRLVKSNMSTILHKVLNYFIKNKVVVEV